MGMEHALEHQQGAGCGHAAIRLLGVKLKYSDAFRISRIIVQDFQIAEREELESQAVDRTSKPIKPLQPIIAP
eukprot:2952845-Pleurochrysis_carterae.AAC.1